MQPIRFPCSVFSLLAATVALCGTCDAQVQVPVNPKATYLRTNNDPAALPAPAIPLNALGVGPGQWCRITVVGDFSSNGGPDTSRDLLVVFSQGPTLSTNTSTTLHRVPGAIGAGPAMRTRNTTYGNLATDIEEDFVAAHTGWTNGTLVKVPAGATHVFVSTFSHNSNYTYFSNNSDPDNDFAASFAAATPAPLQGTAEHVELRTGLNGTTSATPDLKQAPAFSTLSVEIAQRFNQSSGDLWLLAGSLMPSGGSFPVGPLPGLHLGAGYVPLQAGVMTTAPGQWSLFVPPGFAGTTVVLQAVLVHDDARNGLFGSTDGHRIELQ